LYLGYLSLYGILISGVGITHMAGDEARYISAALVHGYDPINSAFYFISSFYSQALSDKFSEI
jgi:hypothetical protein